MGGKWTLIQQAQMDGFITLNPFFNIKNVDVQKCGLAVEAQRVWD